MSPLEIASTVFGSVLAILVLNDVFHTIIVPRDKLRWFRIAPYLLHDCLWPIARRMTGGFRYKEELLGFFAPTAFILLFIVWLSLLQLGFGMLFYGMRHEFQPGMSGFADSCYFAGVSVLTIGFGDLVPVSFVSRIATIVAAVCGLLFMALLVSFLFTLQSQLQFREQVVSEMASRGGAPASGVVLLLRYRELELMAGLQAEFARWEIWLAQIYESHRSFPILLYFRSNSPHDSWVSVIGALLDASLLLTSAIRHESRGRAELFYSLACTTVQSMCSVLELKKDDSNLVSREEFDQALTLLEYAGFEIAERDLAWNIYRLKREGYAGYICALATYFDMPQQAWIKELGISSFVGELSVK